MRVLHGPDTDRRWSGRILDAMAQPAGAREW
jgi:hypothetical protein